MNVPVVAMLFIVFRYPSVIRPALTKKNMIRVLFYALVLIGVFWRLSHMMAGEILWGEVFLAGYFMVSIGIILSLLQKFFKKVARKVSGYAKNKHRKYIFIGMYACFWTFIILPYVLAVFSVHRPKIGDRVNPKDLLDLEYETICFKTQDHLMLEGWFVPQPSSQQTVIIGHGLGANKSNFISLVSLWHEWGYHVFIFDFRGHGHSQGHTLSFGYKESRDIRAALDYLITRNDVDPNGIIGYGVSFGGAAMIQAAAQDSRIKWVIVDSTFADFKTMAQKVVAQLRFVPKFLYQSLSELGLIWAGVEAGCPLTQYSPKDMIRHLKNQPVLIIHGKNDRMIPVEEAYQLHQSACEPKELYLIDAAGHYATLADRDYEVRILNFLARHKDRSM
ncbi:MAG: alpha/beta hydrolase [Candidatus Omnitrophica bacterium]|nr:alpha/beta hydrolase [Candidatus Omnitrophota bacterium]